MPHPDWALKHKVKNSELRYIRGRYYLYQITSKWDPEKKRTKKVTLGMLGTITEKDGFIPKGQSKKGRPPKDKQPKIISCKEFGATAFLEQIAKDIISSLQKHFPNHWQSLFTLALNRLIYQSPLKNVQLLFEESFLSQKFTQAQLGKNQLTQLLQQLGSQRETISQFLKQFITGIEHIVFDASHITSQSKQMKMAQRGYNSARDYDPQVNLFYMFSIDKKMPTYYRLLPGNIQAISALKNCIAEAQLKHCMVVGDKGFHSEDNIGLLDEAKLSYILPLKRNSSLIDYNRLHSKFYEQAYDGHFMYQGRPIFYTLLPVKDEKRVIIFTDKSLGLDEEKTYLSRVNEGYEGYSMENYKLKQISFGTLSIITNSLETSAQSVYEGYKSRMEIEGVFDVYKNLLQADRTYMQSDQAMEGWVFINHLATMMYYRLFDLLKTHDLIKQHSPYDLLMKLSRINKVKINDEWITAEINTKTEKLMKQLDIHVT